MEKQEENLGPVFDHSKDVLQICNGDINYLKQDGVLYSMAEYDRISTKKWVPEPYPVDVYKIYEAQAEDLLKKMIPLVERLMPFVNELDKLCQKVNDEEIEFKRKWDSVRGHVTQLKLKFKKLEEIHGPGIKKLEKQLEALKKEIERGVEDEKSKQ